MGVFLTYIVRDGLDSLHKLMYWIFRTYFQYFHMELWISTDKFLVHFWSISTLCSLCIGRVLLFSLVPLILFPFSGSYSIQRPGSCFIQCFLSLLSLSLFTLLFTGFNPLSGGIISIDNLDNSSSESLLLSECSLYNSHIVDNVSPYLDSISLFLHQFG